MTHTYNIAGLTCGKCVAKAKSQLLMIGDVTEATVQLSAPQATISMQKHVPMNILQGALSKAGPYTITEASTPVTNTISPAKGGNWLNTYKPILIIGAFIIGTTLLIEGTSERFDGENWMRNFMAGFFLVFSFFKLLDLKGFADSYSSYDIIAKVLPVWGYIYPFVELGLGLAFMLNFQPLVTNAITLGVMSVSIIGVLQAVLSKRKIQCACLGAVFNLPMSTITIIEDALMIAMSAFMLMSFL